MPEADLDYKKLGLKCGLEVHQQLDTKKLFCNCPSVLRKDEPDFVVKRRLHAVAGESGEVDTAAFYASGAMEFTTSGVVSGKVIETKHKISKDKEYSYQGYDTTCLVEMDESPPREINNESLRIAIQVSLLLNAKIFPITQIMRKTVIDGSNTSGFQRTLLIARDGFVETSEGKVGIDSVCLEEDSARIVSQSENETIYRLDRLGISLVEIATAPEIKTPEQAKEAALHIGNILRSLKVKRGIGTIRQDVNVSIKNGKRVEIKGVQNPELIKKSVEEEVRRQKELVESKKSFSEEVRGVLPNGKTKFLRPMPGSARMYPETDLPLLKISRNLINEVKKTLPKMNHEIEKDLKRKGITQDLIKLILDGHLDDFEELSKICPRNPALVAKMLTLWRRDIAAKMKMDFGVVEEKINNDKLGVLLKEIKKGKLSPNLIKPIFNDLMKGVLLEDILARESGENDEIEEKILKIIKEKPGLSEKAYMGIVMKEFMGKISGKDAMEIIKKHIS